MAYLDHAATTPMLAAALDAYVAAAREVGNPSSLHAAGRGARRLVEESRERIAAVLGARPSEVIFTSGGTESDNLATKGIYWSRRGADPRRHRGGRGGPPPPHPGLSWGRAAPPPPAATAWWPRRSSTTRSWTRSNGWPLTRAPTSAGCRSTRPAGSTRSRWPPCWPSTATRS